jgi:hypothetical protein
MVQSPLLHIPFALCVLEQNRSIGEELRGVKVKGVIDEADDMGNSPKTTYSNSSDSSVG